MAKHLLYLMKEQVCFFTIVHAFFKAIPIKVPLDEPLKEGDMLRLLPFPIVYDSGALFGGGVIMIPRHIGHHQGDIVEAAYYLKPQVKLVAGGIRN